MKRPIKTASAPGKRGSPSPPTEGVPVPAPSDWTSRELFSHPSGHRPTAPPSGAPAGRGWTKSWARLKSSAPVGTVAANRAPHAFAAPTEPAKGHATGSRPGLAHAHELRCLPHLGRISKHQSIRLKAYLSTSLSKTVRRACGGMQKELEPPRSPRLRSSGL